MTLLLDAPAAAFVRGFATSAALIIAIGAQNAFVLRQGLRREHVGAIVALCAASDALLITLGVAGLGGLIERSPALLALTRWGGAAFLLAYALLAARRALSPHALSPADAPPMPLRAALLACLGFTYLNPHCWLDTVVLLGSISTQQPEGTRGAFGLGAVTASGTWFTLLGYGAARLAPLFARPLAWRVLDAAIALVMFTIAASLLAG